MKLKPYIRLKSFAEHPISIQTQALTATSAEIRKEAKTVPGATQSTRIPSGSTAAFQPVHVSRSFTNQTNVRPRFSVEEIFTPFSESPTILKSCLLWRKRVTSIVELKTREWSEANQNKQIIDKPNYHENNKNEISQAVRSRPVSTGNKNCGLCSSCFVQVKPLSLSFWNGSVGGVRKAAERIESSQLFRLSEDNSIVFLDNVV